MSHKGMKTRARRLLLPVIVAFSLSMIAAQEQSAKSKDGKSGKRVTVTGCLAKGDEANEFSITGADGKTYGLRSNSVALADHLGHKVTVTGTTTKGEKEEKEANEKKEGGKKEYADVQVSNLKMVSTSCP